MKFRPSNSHAFCLSLNHFATLSGTHVFLPKYHQFYYFSIISFNYSTNSFFESINRMKILLERNVIGNSICAIEHPAKSNISGPTMVTVLTQVNRSNVARAGNMFKVNNKDFRNDVNDIVLVSLLLTLNRF